MVQSVSSPAMDQLCGRFACRDSKDFEVAPSVRMMLEPMLMASERNTFPSTWLINGDERLSSPSSSSTNHPSRVPLPNKLEPYGLSAGC